LKLNPIYKARDLINMLCDKLTGRGKINTTRVVNNTPCIVALKTIKYCAHYLTNVSPNRLYIKPQSLLRTTLQIDLPKHMSDLQKTRSKQDLQTKASFNSFDKRNATELSKYVWELKNRNVDYTIKWKLLKRAKPYNCASVV
jgi:hypothetical protein